MAPRRLAARGGRAIWWRQIFRAAPPRGQRAAFRRDRAFVLAYVLVVSAVVAGFGWQRHGSVAGMAASPPASVPADPA